MKKHRIDQMLQECLDGYEAGLTPDECLSAYPERRGELEPMLRQALSLRIAYATSPSDEFRHQAREQLMFAAGRDVKLALARDPDPNFILQERTRFLNVAGASAQEALRDVAPPRLAFWVNARRRLLEAASTSQPAPARRFGAALRYSLSAAVVAVVVAIGAVVTLSGGSVRPDPADAQLAALEQEISILEQRTQQGRPVTAGELEQLVEKTSLITSTIDQTDTEQAEKIGGLILKQQDIAAQAAGDDEEIAGVQQKLLEAQQKLGGAAIEPTTTTAAAAVETTQAPAAATQESTPTPEPTPAPLQAGEVRIEPADDAEYGLTWQQVSTQNFSFVMPDSWRILLDPAEDGSLTLNGNYLALETDGEEPIIVLVMLQGETIAQVDDLLALQLRAAGPDGETIAAETLARFGEVGPPLHHFVLSISLP